MSGKYDWYKAVNAEPALTLGEKAVLGYVAVIYIKDSPTFCVRQSVIAERLATTERTVGGAIRKAKRLGYLYVSRERARGTGRDRADELTLRLPRRQEDTSGHFDERQEDTSGHFDWSDRKKTTELPEESAQSDRKNLQKLPEAANAVSSENDDPRGVSTRGVKDRGVFRDESSTPPGGGVEERQTRKNDIIDDLLDDAIEARIMTHAKEASKRNGDERLEDHPLFGELFKRYCTDSPQPVTPVEPAQPIDVEENRRRQLAALEASPYWDTGTEE